MRKKIDNPNKQKIPAAIIPIETTNQTEPTSQVQWTSGIVVR